MKKIVLIACLITFPAISLAAAHGKMTDKQSKFGITGKIGTLGAGLDLTFKVKPNVNIRLNANGATANYDEVNNGISYKGDLKLSTVGALVDYYPFGNGFRATGGLYSNNNKIDGSSTGNTTTAQIGGVNYDITGATIGSKVDFKSTAPYLGIGWGNAVKGYKNFNFSVDAGVLFQGSPNAKLTASGSATVVGGLVIPDVTADPAFQAELRNEEANLNNDLKNFKYFPVLSVGVSYNF